MIPEIRILSSVKQTEESAWNICFPGILEDYAYLLAVEESGMLGFRWLYVTAWQNETLLAAMPGFLTSYNLDTTLEGIGKKIVTASRTLLPDLLKMKLACLGSPVTESALLGFHPDVPLSERPGLLSAMIKEFEHYATLSRHSLLGLKDVSESDRWSENAFTVLGYKGIAGMPVATLPIDFKTSDDYLEKLSYATRKDMRRKLRSRANVRIEYRDHIDDLLPQLMGLYQQTLARAEMQFEELTPQFFLNVLNRMPGQAFFTLYYAGDTLIGANLLLRDQNTLLDKFFCMDEVLGREHNLYFLSWFTNVDYCLDQGLSAYQSGQAAYEVKLRLGSRLTGTTMYFRHCNAVIQGALRLVAPMFAIADPAKKAA